MSSTGIQTMKLIRIRPWPRIPTMIFQTTIIHTAIIQTIIPTRTRAIDITTSMRHGLPGAAGPRIVGLSVGTRSMGHMDMRNITRTDSRKDTTAEDMHHKGHLVPLKPLCDRPRGTLKSQEVNSRILELETPPDIIILISRKILRLNQKV